MKKLRNLFAIVATLSIVFLSGCKEDEPGIRPTVMETSPLDNAVSVAINSSITATFSVAMNPTTITELQFTLKQGPTAVAGVVSYDGTTATLVPDSQLEANTVYIGTITTGAKNTAGDALLIDHVFSFTTGAAPDVVTPTVASTDPASSAMNISRDKVVTVTFSEAMDASTISTSGLTLTPGLYKSTSSLSISSGDLTYDAKGNPDAVFIIQIASSLTTTSGRQVFLSGGALAANIFWQAGSSATFGTTSVFKGTVLVMESITFNTGASLDGKALTRTGGITMAGNTIVKQ